MIKFQQSQALSSHFESFWSIVILSFWFNATILELLRTLVANDSVNWIIETLHAYKCFRFILIQLSAKCDKKQAKANTIMIFFSKKENFAQKEDKTLMLSVLESWQFFSEKPIGLTRNLRRSFDYSIIKTTTELLIGKKHKVQA